MTTKLMAIIMGAAAAWPMGWKAAAAEVVGLQWQTIAAGSKVSGGIPIGCAPHGTTNAVVTLDGKPLVQSDVAGVFVWQPQTLGKHTLAHTDGAVTLSATYNVVKLDFWEQPAPNPPMAEDAAIAITPVTGEIPQTGGGSAIVTSGSGMWTAAVSDGWISLSAASGAAGKPVAYVVGANADVEERVGYVYVAGHVHTVRQKGLGAVFDCVNLTVERDGGTGTVTVHPADARSSWRARSNCDWISVSPTSGTGSAEVTYQVAPWHEASRRSGTITVGGQVFYITQCAYGPTTRTYCVIDVSGGADAANYPISYLADVPTGGWTDEYKTAKLVLRRIDKPSGTYYAGVFEVTEAQWANVMGGTSASTKPKDSVSYDAIRGDVRMYDWPASDAVAADSFMGRLRQKTGLATLDLPSEAEWEYAARAGVTTKWLCGNSETGLGDYAWYKDHGGEAKHPVGELRPNTWGLYDVHGNVSELCLNRYNKDDYYKDKDYDFYRAVRGGTYCFIAEGCAFAHRLLSDSCLRYDDRGFRLFCRSVPPLVYSTITYENLKGAAHANPATYAKGIAFAFSTPGAVTGYTFTGWTPASITAEMTGAQTVRANWRANAYRIVYSSGGGAGTTAPTDCAYDADATVAESAFVREGYVFRGWATEEGGEVVYAPGERIRNLTSNDGGVVTLYAVWEAEAVEAPVISPADGTVFKTASCTVTVTCATAGATIYCTTNGRTPRPTEANRYTGPFAVTGTTTVIAYAVKGERESELAEATLVYVEPEPLTLANALDERKLAGIATGGDAAWTPVADAAAKAGESSARSGAVGMEQASWLEATVHGRGTLSFWWKTSCEPDPRGRYTYDHVTFTADGEERAKLDGETNWRQVSVTFETDGPHTLRWTYSTDDYEASGYQDCAWVDGISWTGAAAPTAPGVVGDEGATVTGDSEGGFTVTPGARAETVEVTVPDGLDAAKVTVEVPPTVKTVKAPAGVKVKVMSDGHDITAFLDIPKADASGAVNLASATVKDEIAREPLDTGKGAEIHLDDPSEPALKTAPTKPGLVYTLREGATLDVMKDGDSTVGDGQPWTPAVTVKGGASGFYSIRVSK